MRPFFRSSSWRKLVQQQIPEAAGPTPAEIREELRQGREAVLADVKAQRRNSIVLAGASGLLGTALEIALRADGHLVRYSPIFFGLFAPLPFAFSLSNYFFGTAYIFEC
jgi:hypothetical protein